MSFKRLVEVENKKDYGRGFDEVKKTIKGDFLLLKENPL